MSASRIRRQPPAIRATACAAIHAPRPHPRNHQTVVAVLFLIWLTLSTLCGVETKVEPVTVDMSCSASSIAVGDRVTVTITYRWPRGWTATEPDPAEAFRGEFTTDWPPAKKLTIGDEERRIFVVTIAATRSGAWALPRPTFTASDFNGPKTATAPAIILQVGTDAKPAKLPTARIAWVKPPPSEAVDHTRWWLLGIAVAGIAGTAAWFLLRNKTLTATATPLEIFTREWQAASTSGDGKDAGARLSLALRRYAGAIWRFDGPGSTTRETAAQLKGRLPDEEFATLIRLLDRLDDLRWSPGSLPVAALGREIAGAQEWTTGVQQRLDAEAKAAAEAAGRSGTPAKTGGA